MNLEKLLDTKLKYRNLLHFYTLNNEISERKIKEIIAFIITPKRIKYLEINLHKEAKDLCSETYKMWMKEIEDPTPTNRWKDIPCS